MRTSFRFACCIVPLRLIIEHDEDDDDDIDDDGGYDRYLYIMIMMIIIFRELMLMTMIIISRLLFMMKMAIMMMVMMKVLPRSLHSLLLLSLNDGRLSCFDYRRFSAIFRLNRGKPAVRDEGNRGSPPNPKSLVVLSHAPTTIRTRGSWLSPRSLQNRLLNDSTND